MVLVQDNTDIQAKKYIYRNMKYLVQIIIIICSIMIRTNYPKHSWASWGQEKEWRANQKYQSILL